jgi:hypothetical protein
MSLFDLLIHTSKPNEHLDQNFYLSSMARSNRKRLRIGKFAGVTQSVNEEAKEELIEQRKAKLIEYQNQEQFINDIISESNPKKYSIPVLNLLCWNVRGTNEQVINRYLELLEERDIRRIQLGLKKQSCLFFPGSFLRTLFTKREAYDMVDPQTSCGNKASWYTDYNTDAVNSVPLRRLNNIEVTMIDKMFFPINIGENQFGLILIDVQDLSAKYFINQSNIPAVEALTKKLLNWVLFQFGEHDDAYPWTTNPMIVDWNEENNGLHIMMTCDLLSDDIDYKKFQDLDWFKGFRNKISCDFLRNSIDY